MAARKRTTTDTITITGAPISYSGLADVGTDVVNKVAITPLTVDFGREDLNNLATKINEIIARINEG